MFQTIRTRIVLAAAALALVAASAAPISTTLAAPLAPSAIESAPASPAAFKSVEQPCPTCGSFTLYRSKAKNLPERMRRHFSTRRSFRCTTCSWRGWLVPLQISGSEAVEPPAIPDLAALDVALQASTPTLRHSFSPRDLQ